MLSGRGERMVKELFGEFGFLMVSGHGRVDGIAGSDSEGTGTAGAGHSGRVVLRGVSRIMTNIAVLARTPAAVTGAQVQAHRFDLDGTSARAFSSSAAGAPGTSVTRPCLTIS